MSHADVLSALQQCCPPDPARPESGVSLVARFKRADLGLENAGTFIITTDWHLVPDGTQDEWPTGRVCTHPVERLSNFVETLLRLKAAGAAPVVFHGGDLIDVWRTLGTESPISDRVDAVLEDYGTPIERMRKELGCTFFVGNHDARVASGAPRWLKGALKEEIRVTGDPKGRFRQCLGIMHGHQFDGVEILPDEIKETAVRSEHSDLPQDGRPLAAPPGPRSYVVEGSNEGVLDDEFLNPKLRAGNLLPLGVDTETFGRALPFQPQVSPIPGIPNFETRGPLETFYPMARERSWVMSSETERISVLVIGHTHKPRIIFGPRQDGSLFVLMDCGSWRGAKKLSTRMQQEVMNAQVGVIAENDLRIYQLTF